MKRFTLVIMLLIAGISLVSGQKRYGKGYFNTRFEIHDADTLGVVDMWPVYCFRNPADMRKYDRLVKNVKKVYPIAIDARERLTEMEDQLLVMNSKREQKAYINKMEREIKREYTPILRRMTFSQGKILIKLIDRETDRSSYDIVKEMQGTFSATIWQGVAKLFGANLKDTYDKDGEDKVIEQIILLYEAGLI